MPADVVVGFVLTGVALVTFLVWTWRQTRRVDEITGRTDDSPDTHVDGQ